MPKKPAKNPAAVALGRLGGAARVPKGFAALTPEERSTRAKAAVGEAMGRRQESAQGEFLID